MDHHPPVRKAASRRLVRLGTYLRRHRRSGSAMCFELAHRLDVRNPVATREVGKRRPRAPGLPEALRFLAVGTTGTCNASCIHCPTGKAQTAHVPRGVMPMPLFERLIDGIVALGLPVTDQIAFGLFGDGLLDPLVVERARYVKLRLPHVTLSINTNGAAYGPVRHGELFKIADVIALHCESLSQPLFDDLMQPLRLARVQPRYELILRDFPGKVRVSVPVSRRNRHELPQIRDWFKSRGATVVFDPLSSRCADDQRLFRSLALSPARIRCAPAIADDVIVDCDGLVLACCQDFQRREPIGDLSRQSLAEVLADVRREALRRRMAEGRHDELSTCSRCLADCRSPDFPFDTPLAEIA